MPVFNKVTAKIKLVILTKPGLRNLTWYSLDKDNNKTDDKIIDGMKRRFENSTLAANAQVLQFYDNKSNKLIAEFK